MQPITFALPNFNLQKVINQSSFEDLALVLILHLSISTKGTEREIFSFQNRDREIVAMTMLAQEIYKTQPQIFDRKSDLSTDSLDKKEVFVHKYKSGLASRLIPIT